MCKRRVNGAWCNSIGISRQMAVNSIIDWFYLFSCAVLSLCFAADSIIFWFHFCSSVLLAITNAGALISTRNNEYFTSKMKTKWCTVLLNSARHTAAIVSLFLSLDTAIMMAGPPDAATASHLAIRYWHFIRDSSRIILWHFPLPTHIAHLKLFIGPHLGFARNRLV